MSGSYSPNRTRRNKNAGDSRQITTYFIIQVILFVIFLALGVYLRMPSQRYRSLMRLGVRYFDNQEYEKARLSFQNAIDLRENAPDRIDPDPQPNVFLGYTYAAIADTSDDPDSANDNYEQAISQMDLAREISSDTESNTYSFESITIDEAVIYINKAHAEEDMDPERARDDLNAARDLLDGIEIEDPDEQDRALAAEDEMDLISGEMSEENPGGDETETGQEEQDSVSDASGYYIPSVVHVLTQFAGDDPDNVSPDEGAITDVAVSYDASSATISYSSAINDPSLWDGKLIFPYIPPQDAQSYALCYFPECGEYLNYAYNPLIRKGYIAHCEIGAGTAAAASVMDFTVENERLVSLARDGVTYTFRYEGDNVSEISWGSTSLALQYDGGLLQSVTVSGTGRNVFGDGTYTYSYDASGNPESCFYDDGSDMPFTYYFQTDTDGKMTGQNAPTFNLRYYNYTMEYDADPGMLSRLVCDFTSYVAAENNLVTYTMDDYVEIGSADGES